jgi:hypothetical protein
LTARARLVDEIEKLLPRAFVNIFRRRCHFPRNLDLIEHKLAPHILPMGAQSRLAWLRAFNAKIWWFAGL